MVRLDQVIAVVRGVAEQLLTPSVSVYWVYLVSALVIAAGLYGWRVDRDQRSPLGFLRWCFPRRIWGRRSPWHDLTIFVINTIGYSFLFLGPVQAVSTRVAHGAWQLLAGWMASPDVDPSSWGARLVMTAAVVLVADLAFFFSHWLQHRVPLLWEFHKVHHSAPVLQPFTVFRRHPVDVVVEASLSGMLVGAVLGVFGWMSGGSLDVYSILGVNVVLFVFLLAGFNLQHSHVWLSFGPLDRLFISPATHQLHHDDDPRHHGRNLGNMLAIWDALAGTLVRPRGRPPLRFGLGGEEQEYGSLARLYLWPFYKAARVIARGVGGRNLG